MDNHSKPAPPVQAALYGSIQHAADRMSVKTARLLLEGAMTDEIHTAKEACCCDCAGDRWFEDSDCRFYCSGFIKEILLGTAEFLGAV